jgi:hypothetical protein
MKAAVALAASAMMIVLAGGPALSQEQSPARFLDGTTDFGTDFNGDGLYENLVVEVPVQVERADIFSLRALAYLPGSPEPLARAELRPYLDVGQRTQAFVFGGQPLTAINGSVSLEIHIFLADSGGNILDTRTYQTAAYSGTQFEGAAGPRLPEFTGVVIETPEDFDSSGKYEYLNISFEIDNLTSRTVQVFGALENRVAGFGAIRSFNKANNTGWAELQFPGGAISALGRPGPYTVLVTVMAENGQQLFRGYQTSAYNSSDFEPAGPPVAFTGNGTDAGSDADGDGLFEGLDIRTQVNVSLEGEYVFRATLVLPDRYLHEFGDIQPRATVSVVFPEKGAATVDFNLSGQVLRLLQLDGPYTVDFDVLSIRVFTVASGTYLTAEYLSSQFDLPVLPARFSGSAAGELADRNANGLYRSLVITSLVEVAVIGVYQLAGGLFAGKRFITFSSARFDLAAGAGQVSLKFDGAALREAGLDGPYTAVLYISLASVSGPGGNASGIGGFLPPDKLVYKTDAFRAAQFEKRPQRQKPQPPPEAPEVKVGEDAFISRAPGITVEVNRSVPDLFFYYTLDNGRSARFRLTFTRLVAYSDSNGNGAYDPGEERFQGVLSVAKWDAGEVDFSDGQGGKTIMYNLSATLDMTAATGASDPSATGAQLPGWGRITFSFTVTTRNLNLSGPADFTLRGGTEMKIGILIEPLRDLPGGVTGLALEQYLSDERGTGGFRTYEADRTHLFGPGSGTASNTLFRPALSILQKIGLAGRDGREHGYYKWLDEVRVDGDDGTSRYMPVNLTYATDGSQMTLFLNYPLPAGTVALFHDPTVGVNETNAPSFTITVGKIFNPILYAIAIGAAVAVIIVIMRSQRNGRN